jgi:hypothetical protein
MRLVTLVLFFNSHNLSSQLGSTTSKITSISFVFGFIFNLLLVNFIFILVYDCYFSNLLIIRVIFDSTNFIIFSSSTSIFIASVNSVSNSATIFLFRS